MEEKSSQPTADTSKLPFFKPTSPHDPNSILALKDRNGRYMVYTPVKSTEDDEKSLSEIDGNACDLMDAGRYAEAVEGFNFVIGKRYPQYLEDKGKCEFYIIRNLLFNFINLAAALACQENFEEALKTIDIAKDIDTKDNNNRLAWLIIRKTESIKKLKQENSGVTLNRPS